MKSFLTIDGIKVDKEHVVGKRLVPKGSLDKQWNLHVRACRNCNRDKSKFEDEVSAVSMIHTFEEDYSTSEDVRIGEAARKAAGSFSSRTGKPVKDSISRHEFSSTFGNAQMKFTVVGQRWSPFVGQPGGVC